MKWLHGLGLSLLAVFAPIKPLILIATLLIVIDLITGILAARKQGEKITSAGLRRTLTKLILYNIAILLGFLVEFYMIDGFLPLSKIAAGAVGITELKSCLENIDILNGSPVFKSLIEKLGSSNDQVEKKEDKPEDK